MSTSPKPTSTDWLKHPPTWLIIAVIAVLMVANLVLSSNKTTALIWDGIFLAACGAAAIARARSRRNR